MKIFRAVVILALFASVIAFSGCGPGNKNANMSAIATASNSTLENANSAKTNVEELGLLINIPYDAEDIVWKEVVDQKRLIAVLRFSTEDANKVVADAIRREAPQNVTLSSETWFPAELIAQSEMSGDDSLNGLAFSADIFYQEPFTSGPIVRIEGTDYFVLYLSAK